MNPEDMHVGLFNCSVTRQLDKCVSLLLGTLSTEDQGEIEVWANFSETGLESLLYDLLRPEEPRPGCEVGPGECCVTKRETICIRALIAIIPEMHGGRPTGREALVYVCLSEEGIEALLDRLGEPTQVLNLAPVLAATRDTPYMWTVVHQDGSVISQFSADGVEAKFDAVRLAEVDLLLVEPKNLLAGLPAYRLTRCGFEELQVATSPAQLPLPVPDEPFAWRYFRRVTVTFALDSGTGQPLPPRILQVVGWRVERPEGDLICELGVEEDGSWTVYRRGRVWGEERYVAMCEEEFDAAMTARRD